MRQALIITALTAAVCLHVYTWKRAPVTRSPKDPDHPVGALPGPALIIANIRASQQGERITVVGQVRDVWEPAGKRAPHTIILRDRSGALEIVHWLNPAPQVDVGDPVACTGTVDLYRGGLQLRLWTSKDLQVLDPQEHARSGETAPFRK